MYSQGETFYHLIDDEEYELHVLENFNMREKEFLIAEDFDGMKHVFSYDEETDEITLIEDKAEAFDIIAYWKEEYIGSDNIGDWDDDEYYDREDDYKNDDYYDNSDYDGYGDEEDYY
ncbi:MAG: hypothetical protein RR191_01825 [Cetobacterium sp.]|uniref:hypothetical protein n=1 Tax=unclassified Cetobacterium TaxID=2630983 RepID=UPI00163D2F6D|nr:hypothetical protein [Cetobacterium sp. 2A]MBC2855788.1 hypothetical protein [Cetobacterium sp. 2A]